MASGVTLIHKLKVWFIHNISIIFDNFRGGGGGGGFCVTAMAVVLQ